VAQHAEHIVLMYAGMVVEEGDTLAIFDHPLHPYTRHLLSCVRAEAGIKGTGTEQYSAKFWEERFRPLTSALPPMQDLGAGRRVRCWEVPA
jgi:peptide/nickel transport system ATP-binding protein